MFYFSPSLPTFSVLPPYFPPYQHHHCYQLPPITTTLPQSSPTTPTTTTSNHHYNPRQPQLPPPLLPQLGLQYVIPSPSPPSALTNHANTPFHPLLLPHTYLYTSSCFPSLLLLCPSLSPYHNIPPAASSLSQHPLSTYLSTTIPSPA